MEIQDELHTLYTPHIYRAIAFITENLGERLDLEALAEAAYFSPYHFHRIFTRILGETPNVYVNRLRVERAANLLIRNPSLSITEIALTTGFSSSAAFARSFKQYFGRSASEWKIHYQQTIAGRNVVDTALCQQVEANVQIKQMPRFYVAYVVSLLDGYAFHQIDEAWLRLCTWASARDLLTPDTLAIEVSYDNPDITPASKCRYYACLTVPDRIVADNVVGVMEIPAGKCGVFRFQGPRADIQPTYRALYSAWLPRSGYQPPYDEPRRPCYAICGLEPEQPEQDVFCMDICIPVVPR